MLDKQFRIFSFLILLFMLLCYLYSNNNSLVLKGGNLQQDFEKAQITYNNAVQNVEDTQTAYDNINANQDSTNADKDAAKKALDNAKKAQEVAEGALNEVQNTMNKCTVDLKEVYDASEALKDLKDRITSCGDSITFSNPLLNEISNTEEDADEDEDDMGVPDLDISSVPGAGDLPETPITETPATVAETPATVAETPATVAEPPATGDEPPATEAESPATDTESPATEAESPATDAESTTETQIKQGTPATGTPSGEQTGGGSNIEGFSNKKIYAPF